jgi:hypothetical protein
MKPAPHRVHVPALILSFAVASVVILATSGCGKKEETAAGKGNYYTGPMAPKGAAKDGATKAPRAE